MATLLRPLSYRYQWLYDTISRTAALTVGGEHRFRTLALEGLTISRTTAILDLCCGSGQTTRFLKHYSDHVTGLDASPRSLQRARANVPEATFIEGWAEAMPLPDRCFDVVHSSAAIHEMETDQRQKIFMEVWRVLKPGGVFTLVDFHQPHNPLFWPGLAVFLWLFETHTAWQMLRAVLTAELAALDFQAIQCHYYGGGSLQVIQAYKAIEV
ncbi:MAG: class I SAM-dependent methyltransferase [Nodosilinea sp. LVE1205-7]